MATEYDLQAFLKEIRLATSKRVSLCIGEKACVVLVNSANGTPEDTIIFDTLKDADGWLTVWLEDTIRQQA